MKKSYIDKKGTGLLLLSFLGVCVFHISAQNTQIDSLNNNIEESSIRFSTVPNTPQKSMQPYYEALKTASYGIQRFSIFEQIAKEHIAKANTDSILHYGNLYLEEIINWDRPLSDKKRQYTKSYLILATGSRFNGLFDNALQWHFKGIKEAEDTKDTEYQYAHKIGLGKVYNLQGKHTKAISVLNEALEKFGKEWPQLSNEALIYLGDAHLFQKENEKAQNFYNKALKGSKEAENIEMELTIGLKLGRLAENNENYDAALTFYDNSRNKALAEGLYFIYFEGSTRIGNLLYQQANHQAALMALSISYVNAIERENLHYQAEILNIQRKVFSAMDDYQNAYAVMTQLSNIKQKINTQQQRKVSKELEIQYETLQKEKEILSLQEEQIEQESELNRQRTIKYAFLIGFFVILIPVIALLYTYYQKIQAQSQLAKKQQEVNEQKVTSLKQEQELNLIKASIEGQDEERKRIAQELHDSIGGNLAGIKLQLSSLTKGSEKFKPINAQIDETYQLVRDISHTLIPKKFKQNAFTNLIHDLITSIADTGVLDIGFHPHPEEKINALDEMIQMELFKIIQELMTNTMKHANATKVDIHISSIDKELSVLFEDNGDGFDTKNTKNGIGFTNIQNRVKRMKGQLFVDATQNRGTVISLEIPLI